MRKKNILDYFASKHANARMTHCLFVYFEKCKLIRAKSLGMTSFVMRLFSPLNSLHLEISQSNQQLIYFLSYSRSNYTITILFFFAFIIYLFFRFFFCFDLCLYLCVDGWISMYFSIQRQSLLQIFPLM